MQEEPHFFDAHTHVQFSAYDADRAAVLERARAADVWMINVGTQLDTSRAAVLLAETAGAEAEASDRGVFAAIGLHPIHTSKSHHDSDELGGGEAAKAFTSRGEAFDIEQYRRLALHAKTIAIGECGLDYFHLNGAKADTRPSSSDLAEESQAESREDQIRKQKEAFIAQIELSLEIKKPLMIHCRNAFADLIEILKFYEKKFENNLNDFGRPPGVIHFFTGTTDDARALLELGFAFTFGGAITFPPRKGKIEGDYDEVIKQIPLDKILSETDAPYLAPVPYRGQRNEPAYVVHTVKRLAELKDISPEEMKRQIFLSAERIFGII